MSELHVLILVFSDLIMCAIWLSVRGSVFLSRLYRLFQEWQGIVKQLQIVNFICSTKMYDFGLTIFIIAL